MNTLYNNKYDILASTIQPNPASVKYWADLSSNPNGGDLKYFNGTKWVLVNDKMQIELGQELKKYTLTEVNSDKGKSLVFNEVDGGGSKFEGEEVNSFAGVNDGSNDVYVELYAVNKNNSKGPRIILSSEKAYYTNSTNLNVSENEEIATKEDINLLKDYLALAYPTVEAATGTVLNKEVTDLQENIIIDKDNKISGKLKNVSSFSEFSNNPSEQNGHFIALHFTAPEDVELYGEVTSSSSNLGPVKLDKDGIFVVKIKNNKQMIIVHAFNKGKVATSYYRLEDITLQ